MAQLSDYLEANREAFEEDLCDLLRIPSISADSRYKADVGRAADWMTAKFRSIGLETQRVETDGHPIVYAESAPVPDRPTVLVYGHYDVQPPDPLDEWMSPPFEPTRRDGNIYARGATDDKGQMLTHVMSAQACLADGDLPVQLKYVIEGEEEVGSAALSRFLKEQRDRLQSDVVVISDTSQFGRGQPAITYGLRGIAYFELRVSGPKQDLHSGTFGGGVVNPVNALSQLLASLIDGDGRIQVPEFYDAVVPLSDREREQFAALPFRESEFMNQIGVSSLGGEAGYSTLERRWARPTFDLHGIWGGYQGEGGKTVLPARCAAKFSFRLVPNQDPGAIAEKLREVLHSQCPAGVEIELIDMHGAPGFVVPLESPYISAAARAIEQGFGRPPVFIREGGSIPIVTEFSQNLNADTLLLGWGLDDDNTHSPNEKFCLADFHRGIKSSAHLWAELAKVTL
jgi:succinyl-diaminopimelate desuccinylase